jgi:hypothetical protein
MDITRQEIVNTLSNLGIDHADSDKEWILIRCPLHADKKMKNCGINTITSVIYCFSCKRSMNLVSLVQDKMNLQYKDAMKFIKGDNYIESCKSSPDYNLKNNKRQKKKTDKKKQVYKIEKEILLKLNPENFYYTSRRKLTREFCDKFEIKICWTGWYANYFITPIRDKKKGIDTFEARKLCQLEYLKSLNLDEESFDTLVENKKMMIKDYKVYSEVKDQYYDNSILLFLLKPKILYPKGSRIWETIFNIDNLDFNEDLWISEGLGTTPSIYNHITKNITSTFGSEVTDAQMEYLQKFNKRKLIIPDNDQASLIEIEALNMQVDNLWVVDIKSEDTDRTFISDIKKANIIEASRYLFNEYDFFS